MTELTLPGTPLTRRQILSATGSGALTALALTFLPGGAFAGPEEAAAAINALTGGADAESGKITLDLPEIAENGNTVPLKLTVDNPQSAKDHVTELAVVAEANPFPLVVTFHLTPASGKAAADVRIRLAGTQHIAAVAKTSTGKLYMDRKEIKVTIGGCGG
ncbi:MAG: thiosulfate oxidation carrier protein SoxY [Magnetospiraceae bacterium]